ncbi:MAG TPA: hypothetical protein VFN87_07470, partial [Solirubrobacteraceae bacterium]|nr:hypothetical protein [Solirubrobacteraceae bacterium]
RAGRGFAEQVLGIVGVKIIHRQDVPGSAEMIAQMAGTERVWEETEYVRGLFSSGGGPRGTRRPVERYLVHPNEIKTLEPGEAVILSKLPSAQVRRVRVTPPSRAGASPGAREQPPAAPPRADPSPDARAQPPAAPPRADPSPGAREQPPAAPPSPGDGRKPVPESLGARERPDPPTERPPRASPPGPVRRSGPGRSGGRGEPPGRDHPAPGVTR